LDKDLYVSFQLASALIQLQLSVFLINRLVMGAMSACGDGGGYGDGEPDQPNTGINH
jgi:hypothetical protein